MQYGHILNAWCSMPKKKGKWADSWTQKAKDKGYSARSVFKLEELETRFQPLKGCKKVLDLGCAPGSWSEFVRKKRPKAKIVGIDLKEVHNFPGTFVHSDIQKITAEEIISLLEGKADIVLSDMAPYTTGNRLRDHVQQLEVARLALTCACQVLRPGGKFVVKVFDGEDIQDFYKEVQKHFSSVKRLRPKATRNTSVEFFMLGIGYKPT